MFRFQSYGAHGGELERIPEMRMASLDEFFPSPLQCREMLQGQPGEYRFEEAHLLAMGLQEQHLQPRVEDLQRDAGKTGSRPDVQGRACPGEPSGRDQGVEEVFFDNRLPGR